MEHLILLGVLLHNLPIHLIKIFLRFLNESPNLSFEIVRILVVLKLSKFILQMLVLLPKLLNSALAHLFKQYLNNYESNQVHIDELHHQVCKSILFLLMRSPDLKSIDILIQQQILRSMNKISLMVLLAMTLLVQIHSQTNGTESYFLSPHGLGRTPQVDMALDKINGQLRVKRTTYNQSSITYILDNITIGTAYNDAKQIIEIPKADNVKVSGGRIEFTYRFNYTKIENRNNLTGYGYGSVLSDPFAYYKQFTFCEGFLCWRLSPSAGADKITFVQNRMKIKRMQPFNQTDANNIEAMLDQATTAIDPANIESQILTIFNQIFPLALNDSLNHQIFGEKINYTYYSNTHGEMKMNIIHKLYDFGVNPDSGYKVIFVTEIQNYTEPICNLTVPEKPFSFELYGGSQNFHLHCLYESVVSYLQSNGWLDTVLNDNWQSDTFQFYAGDLFDLINNLYLGFSPKAILDGSCVALKDGLRFYSSREFETNSYTLDVTYNCSIRGTNKDGSTVQILKFKSTNKIYIKVEATTKTLNFQIFFAQILNLSFQPVGNYFVSNINLAMFKANSVIKKLFNTYTFGTGFPTITREVPKTRVDRDYVLYYDTSHFSAVNLLDS